MSDTVLRFLGAHLIIRRIQVVIHFYYLCFKRIKTKTHKEVKSKVIELV